MALEAVQPPPDGRKNRATKARKRPLPRLHDSEREVLVMLRDTLKKRIANAPTHTLAALVKQFREIDKELRMYDAKAKRERDEAAGIVADDEWDDDGI